MNILLALVIWFMLAFYPAVTVSETACEVTGFYETCTSLPNVGKAEKSLSINFISKPETATNMQATTKLRWW